MTSDSESPVATINLLIVNVPSSLLSVSSSRRTYLSVRKESFLGLPREALFLARRRFTDDTFKGVSHIVLIVLGAIPHSRETSLNDIPS